MSENIVEVARSAGNLTTMLAIVDAAGLTPTLAGDGLFTVFAPSDEAFDALPDGTIESLVAEPVKLLEVLTYHLSPGRVTTAQAACRRRLLTFQGEELVLGVNGALMVDGAHVVRSDLEARNGIVHVIDRVLLPVAL